MCTQRGEKEPGGSPLLTGAELISTRLPSPPAPVEEPAGGAPSRVHSIVLVFPRLAKTMPYVLREKRSGGDYLINRKREGRSCVRRQEELSTSLQGKGLSYTL